MFLFANDRMVKDIDLNKEILEKIDVGTENLAEYKDKFETQFQKISEANMAALAEYVAHRKVVLELLKKGINIKEDGKFNKEAYISIILYIQCAEHQMK